eukprot:GHUV01050555.1.p1 GENE.GHUV01050555.1~~GHUV01050555.1.p1  ORF type:complete len:101 (-),score=15.84 GHUV01050555.1:116-418(-)
MSSGMITAAALSNSIMYSSEQAAYGASLMSSLPLSALFATHICRSQHHQHMSSIRIRLTSCMLLFPTLACACQHWAPRYCHACGLMASRLTASALVHVDS